MIRLSTDMPVHVTLLGDVDQLSVLKLNSGWSYDVHGISGRFNIGDPVYVPMTAVLYLEGTHIDDLPPEAPGTGREF